jgi:scyllo-inositol 2-dehydrogenase (NADP+)
MRIAIVGYGVQGQKRIKLLEKKKIACIIDKYKNNFFKSIYNVPLNTYDTVFICTPDREKYDIALHCLKNKKNILVEKPFQFKNKKQLKILKKLVLKNKLVFYTAYNHRFEPGLIKIKEFLKKKIIGSIYSCRIFYGNGTSLLVKKSRWRDKKPGVIYDIGSHLIDICMFLFEKKLENITLTEANKFENKAYDHAVVNLKSKKSRIQLEMSLCSWENSFNLDLIGSKGSLHLNSLCKWSNSTLTLKKRKFPSGKPVIKKIFFKKGDPTWRKEHKYFSKLVKQKINTKLLDKDFLIDRYLKICKK